MAILKADQDSIERAGRYIAHGGLVAIPTETVYGLAADASNGLAVAGIYTAKGRPVFNPLIIHVADPRAVPALAVVTPLAEKLMAAFWPGPMTLILASRPSSVVDPLALAGLDTIAIRIPSHPVALAILRAARVPVAAPSANRSGRVSPTTAQHVADDFGDVVPMIVDAGPTELGVESTIIDARGEIPVILRPGAITRADIERVTGLTPEVASKIVAVENGDTKPDAPGQLASHYAPRAAVRLDATDVRAGEALLAFGQDVPPHDGPMLNLSPSADTTEAAAHLFGYLRDLDATGMATIAVMPIPDDGLGEAINDRLRRAAAPRA